MWKICHLFGPHPLTHSNSNRNHLGALNKTLQGVAWYGQMDRCVVCWPSTKLLDDTIVQCCLDDSTKKVDNPIICTFYASVLPVWIITNCPLLGETSGDCLAEPKKDVWNYLKGVEPIWNSSKLFETIWNYLKLFEGSQNPLPLAFCFNTCLADIKADQNEQLLNGTHFLSDFLILGAKDRWWRGGRGNCKTMPRKIKIYRLRRRKLQTLVGKKIYNFL